MLEEYSATHAETYEQLGNMPYDRFERLWDSYALRTILDRLDEDERSIFASILSNPVGDEEKMKELSDDLTERFRDMRRRAIEGRPAEQDESEQQFVSYQWWKPPEERDW